MKNVPLLCPSCGEAIWAACLACSKRYGVELEDEVNWLKPFGSPGCSSADRSDEDETCSGPEDDGS